MSAAQKQQMYELYHNAGLVEHKKIKDGAKTLEAKVAAIEVKTNNSINDNLCTDKQPKSNNRENTALDRKGNGIRKSWQVS